jgi:hypothetical protein
MNSYTLSIQLPQSQNFNIKGSTNLKWLARRVSAGRTPPVSQESKTAVADHLQDYLYDRCGDSRTESRSGGGPCLGRRAELREPTRRHRVGGVKHRPRVARAHTRQFRIVRGGLTV